MKTYIRFTTSYTKNAYQTFLLSGLFLLTLIIPLNTVTAKTYILAIQPILPKEKTIQYYQPLATFLSQVTGHNIKIYATSNYVSYWEDLRKNQKYDIVLDAPHFADYRIKKHNYSILVKIKDTLSFSLITHEDASYFDSEELVGKRVSTVGSPSIAGIRLLHMFPKTTRQPVFIGTNNFQETLKKLKSKAIEAALVPTALISGDISVNTILVTDPIPHFAFSASNRVDKATKDKIRTALLKANNTKEGKKLLEKLNISGFEKTNNTAYDGFGSLLKDVWGYY